MDISTTDSAMTHSAAFDFDWFCWSGVKWNGKGGVNTNRLTPCFVALVALYNEGADGFLE